MSTQTMDELALGLDVHDSNRSNPPVRPSTTDEVCIEQTDEDFRLSIRAGRGRVRLDLSGDLDLDGIRQLDQAVGMTIRAGLPFTIDCRGLTPLNGPGITAIQLAVLHGAALSGAEGRMARLLNILQPCAPATAATAEPSQRAATNLAMEGARP